MESLLAQAGILAPGTLDELVQNPKSRTLAIQPPAIGTSVTAAGLPKPDHHQSQHLLNLTTGDDGEAESDTEGAAMTLEHLAFGRRKTEHPEPGSNAHGPTFPQPVRSNSTGEHDRVQPEPAMNGIGVGEEFPHAALIKYQQPFETSIPTTSSGALSNDMLPFRPMNLKQKLNAPVDSQVLDALEPTEVFSIFYQRSDVYVKALLSVLPDRRRGELLVRQVSLGTSLFLLVTDRAAR